MPTPTSMPVPVPWLPVAGSPLDQARAGFDGLSCGPHPVTVDGRAFAGLPARPVRLDELRDRLHDHRCPATTRNMLWALLVHRARVDRARVDAGVWALACLGCALPALVAISRRLGRGLPAHLTRPPAAHQRSPRPRTPVAGVPTRENAAADNAIGDCRTSGVSAPGIPTTACHRPDDERAAPGTPTAGAGAANASAGSVSAGDVSVVVEVEAAVVAGFLAELAVVDLTRGRVAGRLVSAAHEAGVLACREITGAPTPQARLVWSAPSAVSARHPDLVLARAVAAGAVTRAEAALIGATRLEPVGLAEVAVRRGQSYRDVRAARVRAERKLSVFLREQDTGSIDTFLSHPPTPPATRAGSNPPSTGDPASRTTSPSTHRRRIRRRRTPSAIPPLTPARSTAALAPISPAPRSSAPPQAGSS